MIAVDALLLDFDGLICDTERAAHRSWVTLYGRYGLSFPDAVWAAIVGRASGAAIAAQDLAQRVGYDLGAGALRLRLREKALRAQAEPLCPGVRQLLESAAHERIPCGVVSSSPQAWVRAHLKRLGVFECFTVIVTGEQVEAGKPAPDVYLRALRLLGVDAGRCVAFEDSPIGVASAKAAGVRCVAVPGATGDRSGLLHADLILDSLEHFTIPLGLTTEVASQ